MKVTNNRAKSSFLFYKIQGKMNKVKLKPFESLNITELVDINSIKNNMVISNFAAVKPGILSASTMNVTNPYNDGLSVSKIEVTSGATSGNTFSRRKTSVAQQVRGRFEVKYN